MWHLLRQSLASLLLWSLLLGGLYPLSLMALAPLLAPWQAEGSPVPSKSAPRGSARVGRAFTGPTWFWSRPSATSPSPYNGLGSSGSNLGVSHPDWKSAVCSRFDALRAAHPQAPGPPPIDLLTASGSGLDPDISPAAAAYQLERVATARQLPVDQVRALIAAHTEGATLGLLGADRVHVLPLNLALEALESTAR